jgi:hypothetical protein
MKRKRVFFPRILAKQWGLFCFFLSQRTVDFILKTKNENEAKKTQQKGGKSENKKQNTKTCANEKEMN